MGYRIFNFVMLRTFLNLIDDIKKKKNAHVALIFLLIIVLSRFKLIIPIILFFLYMVIKTFPQCFYYLRYNNLNLENSYVLNVKKMKKNNQIVITIYSYLDINSLNKRRTIINSYFNTTITNIEQNRKIYKITGTIGNTGNNLINILSGYGHLLSVKSETETEFYKKYELKIDSDIKDILKLKDDISFKLKKRVSIELNKGLFIFKLHKPTKKKYYFNKVIKEIEPTGEIPVLLGVNQDTGELVIGDLSKMLDCFINGIKGSGKSCIFNGIIQSLLLWNENIKMTLVDFKYVEFNKYKDLDNTLFIHKMEDFTHYLDELLKEMHKRYKLIEDFTNIQGYNKNNPDSQLLYLIVCIDELSFISSQKNQAEIWDKMITLIQMARAAGIFFLGATQCPDHTQINTTFRRQLDTKIIGRLRQNSDLKICGIDSKEDITQFDVGEFIVNALGIGNIKIKSLFLEGLTPSLTQNLTRLDVRKNQAISGIDLTKHGESSKNLTENTDLTIRVKNYFSRFKSGSIVPSYKDAQKVIEGLNNKKYKTIKIDLHRQGIIYKSTPTATKYKIK